MKVVMIRLTLIVGKSLPIEVCQIVFGVDTLVNSMHAHQYRYWMDQIRI